MSKPVFRDAMAIVEALPEFARDNWSPDGASLPTTGMKLKEAADAKFVELLEEYDAQEYARNRKLEYPDWGTQLNKIYDDGLTKWKSEMVDPVKAKWPKDNSGPV